MNKIYLKHVFSFFFCLLFSFSLQAQIPKLISYQGLLTDEGGVALADRDYSVTINLYDAAENGTPLWSETRTVTLAGGLFNVLLGEITPLDLPFDKMYYLATSIGGIELSPRTAMAASPYALNSAGGGKAYALDSEDGSKLDVVYVNAAGKVKVKEEFSVVNENPQADQSYFGVSGTAIAGELGSGGVFYGSGVGAEGHVSTNSDIGKAGLYGSATGGGAGVNTGVSGYASGGESTAIGLQGTADGSSNTPSYGIKGIGRGGRGLNVGVFGEVTNSEIGQNYGIYGKADRKDRSYAGYFDGYLKVENGVKSFSVEEEGVNIENGYLQVKSGFSSFSVAGEAVTIKGNFIYDKDPTLVFDRGTASLMSIKRSSYGLDFAGENNSFSFTKADGFYIDSYPEDADSLNSTSSYNYGLGLKSKYHGLAITLGTSDISTTKETTFIGFFDESKGRDDMNRDKRLIGSIKGVTSFKEVNWGTCLKSYFEGLLSPGQGAATTNNDGAQRDPAWTGTENQDQSGEISNSQNSNPNDFLTAFTALDCGPINYSSLYEIISKGVEVVKGGISFATSFFSIPFDSEDVWSQGLALFSASWDFGTYLDYILTFDGVSYETGNGDYAEYLIRADSSEAITRGEIVGVRAGEISKSFLEAEHFMAISTAPAMSGAMPNPKSAHLYEQVAFLGQVPIKVGGVVHKGDYIVPSGKGDGFGIAVAPDKMLAKDFHRIVGIAWDESDGKELYTMINTAVGINQNDLANMVDQLQTVVNSLQVAMNKLDPNYEMNLLQTSGGTFSQKQTTDLLDYTVSDTHPSKVQGLFDGARFETEEETIAAVKQAWKEVAHIDVEENEMVRYILENRDKTEEIVEYYSGVLTQLQSMQQSIVEQLQEGK